jgi:hypothetical protein
MQGLQLGYRYHHIRACRLLYSSSQYNPEWSRPQEGKISGRLTSNASSNDARKVTDIARAAIMQADRLDSRLLVVLWISDLRGAFSLLKFNPEDVHLMASRLRSGDIFVHLYGNFGWTGMPFAFEVVTRVLRVLISLVVFGAILMYCDDLVGVSSRSTWRLDLLAAVAIITTLLGPNAEEPEKRRSTEDNPERSLVILGWDFILSHWTVDVAERNRLKALYLFWTTDLEAPIDRHRMEALCSLAQRYSLVYRHLGPLMGDLWSTLRG